MNQPADLNAEQVKKVLNPDNKQWTWLARNVRLRSSLILGSPTTVAQCAPGMRIVDVTSVKESLAELSSSSASLPIGCKVLRSAVSGSPTGEFTIDKIEWSWESVHVVDSAFEVVLRCLLARFVSGVSETAAADDGEDAPAAPAAAQQAQAKKTAGATGDSRPPVGPTATKARAGRGAKRAPDGEPVVPGPEASRAVRHRRAVAKLEKGLEMASAALVEEEGRAGVVRPLFVVGHVKPFSGWPFGGVVVFAQFPFLLDQSWRTVDKWVAYCKKIFVTKEGGRYEVMFAPKQAAGGPFHNKSVVGGVRRDEPAVGASGTLASTAVGASETAAAARGTLASAAAIDNHPAADASPTPASASPVVSIGSCEEAAAAATGTRLSPQEGSSRQARATDTPLSPGDSGSNGTAAGSGNAASPGSEGSGMAAVNGSLLPEDEVTPEASGSPPVPEKSGGGASATAVGADGFHPMSEPLQYRFIRALQTGKVLCAPEEEEDIEWSVVTRSPAPTFSLMCTFSSVLNLGRSQNLPCGIHLSNNYITAAYPARDPRDEEVMELQI